MDAVSVAAAPEAATARTIAAPPAHVRDLGRMAYEPVWRAMQAFTDARTDDTPDELWLVEHDPVFTLGQAGKPEHVLMPGDIPVVPRRSRRPGDLSRPRPDRGLSAARPARLKVGVREYVNRIEQAIIDTLGDWNIDAQRRDGAPGVYVDGAKVAALGIRVRRGCTFHGLAFNIAMDLEPFHRINPCGYAGSAGDLDARPGRPRRPRRGQAGAAGAPRRTVRPAACIAPRLPPELLAAACPA